MINLKRILSVALVLMLCASALAAQTDVQVAVPPPFNPGDLDPEMQTAHFLSTIKNLDDIPEGKLTLEVPVELTREAYEQMTGLPAEEDSSGLMGTSAAARVRVVGYVKCSLQAHSPHIGRDSGTVKAKSSGSCRYTPVPGRRQPERIDWYLHMALVQGYYWRVWMARHYRDGYYPVWEQDNAFGGTQVDSFRCENGGYTNVSGIYIVVPWGYTTSSSRLKSRSRAAAVTGC